MAALAITTTSLPPVVVAAAYNQTLAASGGTGPYTWSILNTGSSGSGTPNDLPAWLTLNTATGAITGTATTAGVYGFTVQVKDSLGALATQFLAIVSGYTLISDIAAWVTGKYLKRTDVSVDAQQAALQMYRVICAKIPFDSLTAISPEIPLVQGQDTYDLSVLVPPLLGIISIRLTINSTTRRRLRRSSARLYDSLSIIQNGQPSTYARTAGSQIQINPPPDSNNYSIRVRYWTRPPEVAAPNGLNTVLGTPLEWDPLFQWETAWWMLNEIGQEERAASLVQPMMMPRQSSPKKQTMMEIGIIPRLWNELLTTVSQKENVDEDFSVNPVMRPYSYRGR